MASQVQEGGDDRRTRAKGIDLDQASRGLPARRTPFGPLATRVVAVGAVGAQLTYLGWRLTHPGTWWLSIPLLILELWGLVALGLVVWESWPRRPHQPDPTGGTRIGVVVTCTYHAPEELERTLIACRSLRGVDRVVVALRPGRTDLETVAHQFGVAVVTHDGIHLDAFWQGANVVPTALVAWLEAGQVPLPDLLEQTSGAFLDPSVGLVQGRVGWCNADSLAHLRNGRDEDAFRSEIVYGNQARGGGAPWLGGGSVARAAALTSARAGSPVAGSTGLGLDQRTAVGQALSRLWAAGWTSHYQGHRELVLDTAPDTLDDYLRVRRRRAVEALGLFRTADSPLRVRGLRWGQRLSAVARAVPFTTSTRQLGLTLVLVATLITGALPVAGVGSWLGFWLPALMLGTAARHRLARGTMGWGDWTRQHWRTLSADLGALAEVAGIVGRVPYRSTRLSGFRTLGRLRSVVGLLVVVDLAVIVRGLTLFWPHLLPRLTLGGRVVVLGLALAVLGSLVDVTQMAVRRTQRRTTPRLTTRLAGTVAERRGQVIDLSPAGLGVVLPHRGNLELGDLVAFTVTVPDGPGSTGTVSGRAAVRSLIRAGEHWRFGLLIADMEPDSRRTLIGYCAVGHRQAEGDGVVIDLSPSSLPVARSGQIGPRLATMAASVLGGAFLVLGPTAAPSLAEEAASASVCLRSSAGAATAGATVTFLYDGRWRTLGATGPDGCVRGPLPGGPTEVMVSHRGAESSITQDLGHNPRIEVSTMAVVVRVVDEAGVGVAGTEVQYLDRGWDVLGVTGADGRIKAELLPSTRHFAAVVDGRRQARVRQNLAGEAEVVLVVAGESSSPETETETETETGDQTETGGALTGTTVPALARVTSTPPPTTPPPTTMTAPPPTTAPTTPPPTTMTAPPPTTAPTTTTAPSPTTAPTAKDSTPSVGVAQHEAVAVPLTLAEIDGPIDRAVDGPVNRAIDGPIDGPMDGPMDGQVDGDTGADAGMASGGDGSAPAAQPSGDPAPSIVPDPRASDPAPTTPARPDPADAPPTNPGLREGADGHWAQGLNPGSQGPMGRPGPGPLIGTGLGAGAVVVAGGYLFALRRRLSPRPPTSAPTAPPDRR